MHSHQVRYMTLYNVRTLLVETSCVVTEKKTQQGLPPFNPKLRHKNLGRPGDEAT